MQQGVTLAASLFVDLMKLIPILETLAENESFADNPISKEYLEPTIDFYKRVGFVPPWISYYAELEGNLVGACAFKGQPVNSTVEIAYGTFEPYRQQGVGAAMCKALVALALQSDSTVRITARTLPEANFSTRILEKNGFIYSGTVIDPEDGEVWEWEYEKE
jgi:[ribosomal protein S5]-alanine N-acetyltransferase